MKESVITVNFDVESEAYQALSEIKRHPDGSGYFVSAASLIKKENGHIVLKDGFDTGVDTADDAAYGSLIGSLVGILGGPLGVLFGGSIHRRDWPGDPYYPAYVELGHGGPHPAPPHPYVRPAFDAASTESFDRLRALLDQALK